MHDSFAITGDELAVDAFRVLVCLPTPQPIVGIGHAIDEGGRALAGWCRVPLNLQAQERGNACVSLGGSLTPEARTSLVLMLCTAPRLLRVQVSMPNFLNTLTCQLSTKGILTGW